MVMNHKQVEKKPTATSYEKAYLWNNIVLSLFLFGKGVFPISFVGLFQGVYSRQLVFGCQ